MFDLNEEVEQWRDELLRGDSVSETEADELENHLRETYGDLQSKLDSKEAFWLAVRRLGSPEALAIEFSKINTAHIWRRRALWMLVGYLIISLMRGAVGSLDAAAANFAICQQLPLWFAFAASSLGFTIFFVGLTYWTWSASHGRPLGLEGVTTRIGGRARAGGYAPLVFLTLAALAVPFIVQSVTLAASNHFMSAAHFGISAMVQRMTSLPKSCLLFGTAAVLVCWLAQKQDKIQSKRHPGRTRVSVMLTLLGATMLLGFAMLSNGLSLLAGPGYASY